MFPVSGNYNYASSYDWARGYAFQESLNSAYGAIYGIVPQTIPYANYSFAQPELTYGTGYTKSVPDLAYASLFAANSSPAYIGLSANSWGPVANLPPVLSPKIPPTVLYEPPVGDLYTWDTPPPEEPTKRRRREKPDPPSTPSTPTPQEPAKPRQTVTGKIIGDPVFFGAEGEKYQIAGEPGKIYNLMSDKNIQVNGKVDRLRNDYIGYREMGFVVNGRKEIKVFFDENDKMTVKVKEGNTERTLTAEETTDDFTWSPSAPGRDWPKLTIKAKGGQEGERWEFDVTYKATTAGSTTGEKSRFLNLAINGYDIISNDFTTTGLWGHSFDGTKNDVDYKSGVGAGGVLRKSDGTILGKSASQQDYNAALKGYEMRCRALPAPQLAGAYIRNGGCGLQSSPHFHCRSESHNIYYGK